MTELLEILNEHRAASIEKQPPIPAGTQRVRALLFDAGDILYCQDQYREAVLRLYGISEPDLIEAGKQILAEEDDEVMFFEGVRQTLLELKQKGFLLGIVTDTANSISAKLSWFERGGFGHVWDSIISSMEIGSAQARSQDLSGGCSQQLGRDSRSGGFRRTQGLRIGWRTRGWDEDNSI